MQKGMSALPPKADIRGRDRDVRFGPKADSCNAAKSRYSITSSANLLEMHRHVEAQRLGGLEVDDKLILRRRLHRHVGRLLAFEDAIDVTRCRMKLMPTRHPPRITSFLDLKYCDA